MIISISFRQNFQIDAALLISQKEGGHTLKLLK